MDISKAHLHWRVSKYNGVSYKSYSLARSIRKDGKNRKEILLPLGKLTDQEAARWRQVLKALKGEGGTASAQDLIIDAHYAYLDVATALETWRSWGLDKVFSRSGKHQVPLAAVTAALTINRCIDPGSKVQASSWFKKTALSFLLDVDPQQMNPSRIFRELTEIERLKGDLCDHLYKEHLKRDPEAMKSVFYDLSSTTFSGSRCLLMKWGHCKEGFENHIVLALVVNEKGLPVYWAVLSGNTADVSTIEWLLQSLKDRFEIATPTMVFDRGMVSDDNLTLLENEQIKYISAMDKNQLEDLSTGIDFTSLASSSKEDVERKLRNTNQFTKYDTTYYHEIQANDETRRYILCFNPQLFEDQGKARQESLLHFQWAVEELNGELLKASKNRDSESTLKKFNQAMVKHHVKDYVSIDLNEKTLKHKTENGVKLVRTYQGVVDVDQQKQIDAGRLDGFWMLVTNQLDRIAGDPSKLIQSYRDKVMIESSFRDIKSFVEVAPIHVWTIDHVKAHYTICILAHLIDRTLSLALHQNKGGCSRDIVSHASLFRELSECRLNHVTIKGSEESALSVTRPTEEQKDLLSRIGFTHLVEGETIRELCSIAK
jgi:transposase